MPKRKLATQLRAGRGSLAGVVVVNYPGEISLISTTITALEGGQFTVIASRSKGSKGAVAVDWTITGIPGQNPASGTLSWVDGILGNASQIVNAALVVGDTTGTLTLSNLRRTDGGTQNPSPGSVLTGSITILNAVVNQAPVFTVAPPTAIVPQAGGTIQFTAVDSDPGDTVIYSLPDSPQGYTINPNTGLVTTNSLAAAGALKVRATDSQGLFTEVYCQVSIQLPIQPGAISNYTGGPYWSSGPSQVGTGIPNFETFLNGRKVDAVTAMSSPASTWGTYRSGKGDYGDNFVRALQDTLPTTTIIHSYPMFADYDNMGPRGDTSGIELNNRYGRRPQIFYDIANTTQYDNHYTAAAQAMQSMLVGAGRNPNGDTLIIRLAWEFEAYWMHWAMCGTSSNPADIQAVITNFKAAWAKIVTKFKAVMPAVRFDCSPSRMRAGYYMSGSTPIYSSSFPTGIKLKDFVPGAAYVDFLTHSLHDVLTNVAAGYHTTINETFWDQIHVNPSPNSPSSASGLTDLLEAATFLNRPIGLSEWGVVFSPEAEQGSKVRVGSVDYVCRQSHTSSAATQPGVGGSWNAYWIRVAPHTFTWTNWALNTSYQRANHVPSESPSFFLRRVHQFLYENKHRVAWDTLFAPSFAAPHISTNTYDQETGQTVPRYQTKGAQEYKRLWGSLITVPDYTDPLATVTLLGGRTTVNVSTSAQLTTALANAVAGQTIQLAAGTYSGNFVLNKTAVTPNNPIIVKGAPAFGSKITGMIQLQGKHSTLLGLQFDGATSSGAAKAVLGGASCETNHILGCRFTQWGAGSQGNPAISLGFYGFGTEIAYCEFYSPYAWNQASTDTWLDADPNNGIWQGRMGIRSDEDSGNPTAEFHHSAWVHHNWFHDFPAKPTAAYQSGQSDAIEVGQTTVNNMPEVNARWWIESNLIERHNGGDAVVDLKVSGIVLRNNTYDSTGFKNARLDIRGGNAKNVDGTPKHFSYLTSNWAGGAQGGGVSIHGGYHIIGGNYVEGELSLIGGNTEWWSGADPGAPHCQAAYCRVAANRVNTLTVGKYNYGPFPALNNSLEGNRNLAGTAAITPNYVTGGHSGTIVEMTTALAIPEAVRLASYQVGPNAMASAPAQWRAARGV